MKKIVFGLLFALCASAPAQNEGEMLFGYGYDDEFWDGTYVLEDYNVGYLLKDPALVGLKVEGVQIPMADTTGIANLRAWLSTSLTTTLVDSVPVFTPDIESVSVAVDEGTLEVRFSRPYTLTEAGVYVGYSFRLTSLNRYPLVCTTPTVTSGAFLIMTTSSVTTFTDFTGYGEALAMKTILSGAPANAVASEDLGTRKRKVGTEITLNVPVVNHGSTAINTIGYTYTFNGRSVSDTHTFDTPIPACYGIRQTIPFTLTLPAEAGTYPFNLTIESVNGEANTDAANTSTATLMTKAVAPTHRPLMEEYTGAWCGWCVRGIYAMEQMREAYGDQFIGVAIHAYDEMEIISPEAYPSEIRGWPAASLERTLNNIDPYYGSSNYTTDFYIAQDWEELEAEVAPAELSVEAEWNADGTISAKATANFPEALADNPYRIGFYIVADDLHNDTIYQKNYYAGGSRGEMGGYESKSQYLVDFHFNDVAIYALDYLKGNAASLPASVNANTDYDYNVSINSTEIVSIDGEALIQDTDKLYAVAMLIDSETGVVMNAAKAHVENASVVTGLSQVTGRRAQVTAIFGLDGKRRARQERGVNIVRYSDGTTRKIVR